MIKIKKIGFLPWAFALGFFLLDMLFSLLTSPIPPSIIAGPNAHTLLRFSFRHVITPLIGVWGGTLSVLLLFFAKGLVHACTAMGSKLLLFWHLPTLCGALYFSLMKKDTWYTRAIAALPAALCMVLFWIHPVGRHAYLYPLYWVIPIAVTLITTKPFFFQALGSTFTAHAVGSVLWLYSGILSSPAAWIALIPVVACERFGMAILITGIFHDVNARITGTKKIAYTPSASIKSHE